MGFNLAFNPLNAELNPICQLLALLGANHILHVSGIRVNVNDFHQNQPEVLAQRCNAQDKRGTSRSIKP